MSETTEQIHVAKWLDLYGVMFAHIPNGGKRGKREAKILKDMGVKAGMPDLLIFDRPTKNASKPYVGLALEMKDVSEGRVSKAQREKLEALAARGWLCIACHGANAAIERLKFYGYGA